MIPRINLPGGDGEKPIGTAKREAKALWNAVKTQADWEALTAAQRNEAVRRFIKWMLMYHFDDRLG